MHRKLTPLITKFTLKILTNFKRIKEDDNSGNNCENKAAVLCTKQGDKNDSS
ncbi:hypothetical protein GAMM_60301 [Gammaproteobacteria bacterium]